MPINCIRRSFGLDNSFKSQVKVNTCLCAIGVGLRNDPGLGSRAGQANKEGQEDEGEHGWSVLESEDGSTTFFL